MKINYSDTPFTLQAIRKRIGKDEFYPSGNAVTYPCTWEDTDFPGVVFLGKEGLIHTTEVNC